MKTIDHRIDGGRDVRYYNAKRNFRANSSPCYQQICANFQF